MSLYKQLLEIDVKKMSEADIINIIENNSNVEEIQIEVDNLFAYYGDEQTRFSYNVNQVETQTLVDLADVMNGMFVGINGRESGMNEPGYVQIRFNGHKNVQFLMMFRSDEDLSVIKSRYKHIINNIYLR